MGKITDNLAVIDAVLGYFQNRKLKKLQKKLRKVGTDLAVIQGVRMQFKQALNHGTDLKLTNAQVKALDSALGQLLP